MATQVALPTQPKKSQVVQWGSGTHKVTICSHVTILISINIVGQIAQSAATKRQRTATAAKSAVLPEHLVAGVTGRKHGTSEPAEQSATIATTT